MKHISLIFFPFFICLAHLAAQQDGLYFHHLTVEDGLSEGTNHFITTDSEGFVWISSINGLNRYDGRQVKVYQPDPKDSTSLFGQNIQSRFFEWGKNELWFTTEEGLNCYRRQQDNFWHIQFKNKVGLPATEYHAFHLDKAGNLWFILDYQAVWQFHIPSRTFHHCYDLPPSTQRVNLQVDEKGEAVHSYCFNFNKGSLFQTDYLPDGSFIQSDKALPKSNPLLKIRQILPENDTLVWLATDWGLCAYNPQRQSSQFFKRFNKNQPRICFAIAPCGKDSLWVSSDKEGLLVFDKRSRTARSHFSSDKKNEHSLSTNQIIKISTDWRGGLWLTTDHRGVDFAFPAKKKFNTLWLPPDKASEQEDQDIQAFAFDHAGNVWCATPRNGVYVFNKNKQLVARHQASNRPQMGLPGNEVWNVFKDRKDRMWVLTKGGAAVWQPGKNGFLWLSKRDHIFTQGCQLKNGKIILVNIFGGIVEAKEDGQGSFLLEKIQAKAAQGSFIAIWEDSKGRLFCSWESASLKVLDATSFKLLKEIPIAGFTQSFWENPEDGSVWIANSFGLFRLDSDLTYRGNQLPEQTFIYCLLPDRQGRLWLSTNKGLARFDRATGNFQTYSLADGLSALQYNWFAALRHPSGEFWFGSTDGISTFFPEKVLPFNIAANPVITKISIHGEEATNELCAKTSASNFAEMEALQLDYQENTLAFEFAALEYADPANIFFQYKMQGYETEWVNAGTNNQARYPKLPAGTYAFLVKATNSDGIWSEKVRRLEIIIQPPIWETWWFILIAIIMVGFFGYSIFLWVRMRKRRMRRLQLEQQLALEQQRQRIARDMHDDIGSGLSALSMRAEIAAYRQTPEDLRTEINKIHTSASELSGKIREVIWAVGASNDSLPNLISYLHQYALDLFEHADLDCFVNLPPGEIPNRKVYGEHRRSVFLAYKEALNNISKHSGATSISIAFSLNANNLAIEVADNGNGFSLHLLQQSTGNGLLNMKNRMVDIGGHCEIKTSASGTQIRFVLPLAG